MLTIGRNANHLSDEFADYLQIKEIFIKSQAKFSARGNILPLINDCIITRVGQKERQQ